LAQCPSCNAEIHEDFGLVVCGSCGASFMLDMDGEHQNQQEQQNQEIELITESQEGNLQGQMPTPIPIQEIEFNEDAGIKIDSQIGIEEESISDSTFEPVTPLNSENMNTDDINENINENINEQNEELHIQNEDFFLTNEPTPLNTEQTMEEVTNFANSEISSAKNGIYIYTLRIDGIDNGEIKNHIYNVLKDSRLKLNSEELIDTIKNGHLTIRNLSPVKAFVVINGIKRLPLDIYWEQHDITS
jgi:hypothetical protein